MRAIAVVVLVVLLSACSQEIIPAKGEVFDSLGMSEKQIVLGDVVARASDAQFGRSIALEGERMVVTCECVGQAEVAYILERNAYGVWKQIKSLQAPKPSHTYMDPQVALSGDTVVISSAETGIVSIFYRNRGGANNWGLVKELTGAALYYDGFGDDVSLENDMLVVGAPSSKVGTTDYQGAAYIFQRNEGGLNNWGRVKRLTATDGQAWDNFGGAVALSGDTVLIGAYGDDVGSNETQGSAYLFERNAGGPDSWGQVQKLTPSGGLAYDFFGDAVAISGDTLVVGAWFNYYNDGKGYAYVYERGTGKWNAVKKLTSSDSAYGDYFGHAVAIHENTVVVGAIYDTVGTTSEQGSAYLFLRNRGGENNWGQLKKLTASDGSTIDLYGSALAVGDGTVVIAAPLNDVGGKVDKGSVYIYE